MSTTTTRKIAAGFVAAAVLVVGSPAVGAASELRTPGTGETEIDRAEQADRELQPVAGRQPGDAGRGAQVPVTLDQKFAAVAAAAPEFAGMYADRDRDVLHVNVTDDAAADRVRRAILEVFPAEHLPAGGEHIEYHDTRRGLEGPMRVHLMVSRDLLGRDGFVSSDYDEEANQAVVGVNSKDLVGEVDRYLATQGISREMVRVEVAAELEDRNLDQPHHPRVGGLRIGHSPAPGENPSCTLGFNAARKGAQGFVTNSHCTNVKGGTESTYFWQPAVPTCSFPYCPLPLAVEVADPVHQPTLYDFAGCPSGQACRFSDAAFARYLGSGLSGGPHIAKPEGFGSLVWNGRDDFDIAVGADALKYESVEKVGSWSGRFAGFVTGTCVNLPRGSGITLLCQDMAALQAGPGDSGSPVFTRIHGTDAVMLRGIIFGGAGNVLVASFSPISAVATELGLADY